MHASDLGTLDYLRDLRQALDAAPRAARGALVECAAQTLSLSRAEIYRRLHRLGWRSGLAPRANRGASVLSYDEAKVVSALLVRATRANGKRTLTIESAYRMAAANGLVSGAAAGLDPATVGRVLRRYGLHPDQAAADPTSIALATPHPNHTWQIDASVCVMYYLKGGGLEAMSEREFYKNKPDNLKRIADRRLIRFCVTDHYSGAFYFAYRLGGEDTENLFTFFLDAIHRREHPQDPFHGVPLQLVDDPGAANTSHLFDNFLQRLGVRHLTHLPHNPRAKGQVEVTMNIIERGFEGRLRFGPRIGSIEALNERAHAWMRAENGDRKHSRHGHSRYALWQTIRAEELRLAPPRELCRELLRTKPQLVTVSRALMVRYQIPGCASHHYDVSSIPDVRVGDRLEVVVNPYRAPNVWVITYDAAGAETLHELSPRARNRAGFYADAPIVGEAYRAARDTDVDRARKEMLKLAYGAATLREAKRAEAKNAQAFAGIEPFKDLEGAAVAHYVERKGTPLPIERPRTESPRLSHVQAAKRLRERGIEMTGDRYRLIASWYPEGVAEDDLDALAARLEGRDVVPREAAG